MIFTVISIISFIGLLSYYIIFSRIKISSFDIENTSFKDGISLIICAKNELKNIKQFFPYWITQNYSNFELIIVNDESDDGSYEYLTELEKKYPNLNILNMDRKLEKNKDLLALKGKRYALLKGIEKAKNNYLVFTDADCKPVSKNWLTEITRGFYNSKTEIILGYSPYFKEKTILNFLIQIETSLTALHYFGFANIGKAYMGVGRNIAYKKSILNISTFLKSNKSISGDDDLLFQQLANPTNVAYTISENSVVKSVPSNTFASWFQQKKRHIGAGLHYSLKMKIILNLFPVLLLTFFSSLIGMFFYNVFFSILFFIFFFILVIALVKTNSLLK